MIKGAEDIYNETRGDYWLTQQICQTICTAANVLETQEKQTPRTHQQATAQSPRRRLMQGAFPKSKGAQRSDPAPLFPFLGCPRTRKVASPKG
jgi:hypothetical protein